MKAENPAKGKKGFLLYTPIGNKHFFRVYENGSFKDYDLCAESIEIQILDRFTVLKEGAKKTMGKLDYNARTLGTDNKNKLNERAEKSKKTSSKSKK